MPQKHLHELLQEDQEPFQLKNYIADRRFQLKRQAPKSQLQVKKRKPISQASGFPQNFCKTACFFAYSNSPDPRKSPLFELQSPAKSPCKNPNTIFLHVPARTAALLLDAAIRIQKQSSTAKTKTQSKSNGFGLFGSFIKRLTLGNKNRKREIASEELKLAAQKQTIIHGANENSAFEKGFSCSCNRRTSSAFWSESNEGKSLDLDLDTSSSTCHSDDGEDFDFVNKVINLDDLVELATNDRHFCESPFHFVLCGSPSSGHRTPDFSSPAISPNRHKEGKETSDDVQRVEKYQANERQEEEEDKEQCSPVSVLDPLFEDDDIGHDDQSEEDGFDLECSYAIVQRAKQKLLQKLRRFEKLAELDPVELEKRMLEEEQDFDDSDSNSNDLEEDKECEGDVRLIIQNLTKSDFNQSRKIPVDMKRLVSDLIKEEGTAVADREATVKRVLKRLESWKNVESNTIDMMVEHDFRRDVEGWKQNQEQVEEMVLAIELGVFGILMEELSEELLG